MKEVRITKELFMLLIKYHFMEDVSCEEKIKELIQEKLDAMERRELYTRYKTSSSEEEKNRAKEKYFEKANIPKDFRY